MIFSKAPRTPSPRAAPRGLGLRPSTNASTPARANKLSEPAPRCGVKGAKKVATALASPLSRVAISSPTLLARTHEAYGPEHWTRKEATLSPDKVAVIRRLSSALKTSTPPRAQLPLQHVNSVARGTPPPKKAALSPKGTTAAPPVAVSIPRTRRGRTGVPCAHLSPLHRKASGSPTDPGPAKEAPSPPLAAVATPRIRLGGDRVPVSHLTPVQLSAAKTSSTRQPLSRETRLALRSRAPIPARPRIPHGEVSKMPAIIVRPASDHFSIDAWPSPSPSEASTIEEADPVGLTPGWTPKPIKDTKRGTTWTSVAKPLRERTNDAKAPWRGTSAAVVIPAQPGRKAKTPSPRDQASPRPKTNGKENTAGLQRRRRANTTSQPPKLNDQDAHVRANARLETTHSQPGRKAETPSPRDQASPRPKTNGKENTAGLRGRKRANTTSQPPKLDDQDAHVRANARAETTHSQPGRKAETPSPRDQASPRPKTNGKENTAGLRGRKRANTTSQPPKLDDRDAHVRTNTCAETTPSDPQTAGADTRASHEDSFPPDFSPTLTVPPVTLMTPIKEEAPICFVPEVLTLVDISVVVPAVDPAVDASPTLASPERIKTPEACSPLTCFAEKLALLIEDAANEEPTPSCVPECPVLKDAPTRVRISGGVRPLLLPGLVGLAKTTPAPPPPPSRPASVVSKQGLRPFLLQADGRAATSPPPPTLSAVRRGWLRLTAACSRAPKDSNLS